MSSGWEIMRLEDCFKLKSGDGLTSRMMDPDGKYPVIGGNGIAGYHNTYNLSGSNVIIGRVGALCGNVRHIKERIWLTDNAFRIIDFKYEFDHSFLTYLLNHKNLREYARQTAQPVISNSSLKDVILEFPKSLSVQRQIVTILDEAIKAIDKAKENAERNLKNAQELFESYLQSVYATHRDDWERKYLPEISENYDNKRVPITKHLRKEGIYPYYGASGIVDYVHDYIFEGDYLLVSEDGANLLARTYPIAFSINGKSWVNNHAHILKFQSIHTQRFVEYYLNSIKLDKYVSGMAQPKLNQAMLNKIPILYPPKEVQMKLNLKFDSLSQNAKRLQNNYQNKLNYLEELKKSILNKAFTGQLNLKQELAEL